MLGSLGDFGRWFRSGNSLGNSVRHTGKARSKMGIQYWSHDIIFVNLPWELQEHDELQKVLEIVRERCDYSVVVDFSRVSVAAWATLTRLLYLRQLLHDQGRKLIFCGVAPATRGVFAVTRLDEVFDFAKDEFAALAHLQQME
jgi:anti-anti-sigma regulatory factor